MLMFSPHLDALSILLIPPSIRCDDAPHMCHVYPHNSFSLPKLRSAKHSDLDGKLRMLYTWRGLLCPCPSPSPIEHNRLPPPIQLVLLPPPLRAPLCNLPKLPHIIICRDILLRIIPTELYPPPILTCLIQVLRPTYSVHLCQGIIDSPFI